MKPWNEKSKEKDPKLLQNKLAQLNNIDENWAKIKKGYPEIKTGVPTQLPSANLWARTNFILVRPNKPDENGK